MIITPHLGIGDILLVKMKEVSNNLNIAHININKQLIIEYCENYEVKLTFIAKFINLLFPNTNVYINDNPCDFHIMNNYKITKMYIYNFINDSLLNKDVKYADYIVFHTKMRHDRLMHKFNNEILPSLDLFFASFKTSKTIIILGERSIGQNIETQTYGTIQLYNNLLLLNKNNTVVDLTVDVLTCGNPDFSSFLSDIEIINKAICNITFGIGGPFSICNAFSKNNISFIPFYDLCPYKQILDEINQISNSVVENINSLEQRILNYVSSQETETKINAI